jgi:protease I
MDLRGKRVAILVEDNYEDLELWYPALRLREANADVTIVGPEASTYKSTHGIVMQADISADQVQVNNFDALVIPGNSVADALSHHPAMLVLLREAIQQGKVVATIFQEGRTAATAHDEHDQKAAELFGLQAKRPQDEKPYGDSAVIREGNLIRARTPVDLPAFCRMIIAALSAPPTPPAADANRR